MCWNCSIQLNTGIIFVGIYVFGQSYSSEYNGKIRYPVGFGYSQSVQLYFTCVCELARVINMFVFKKCAKKSLQNGQDYLQKKLWPDRVFSIRITSRVTNPPGLIRSFRIKAISPGFNLKSPGQPKPRKNKFL